MRRLFMLAPLAGLVGGCVIYDTRGKCADCDDARWDEDSGDTHEEAHPDEDDTGTGGDADTVTEASFVVDPSEIEVGQTLIASLTAVGDFDYSAIAEVALYGDATLLAYDVRTDEVLLTISVAADATPGTLDLVLARSDGSAELLDDAVSIVPVGGAISEGDGDGRDTAAADTGSGDGCP